ncbi:MAG TPA: hypothetical protein VKK61_11955, partial [Tepidisphaeraceae bacterium]|nr:hypothetical protein [Tepidisphaeraceae bacterium]
QLVQDPPPLPGAASDEEPVRLFVHRNEQVNLKLSANDFWDLRMQHGREVDQYLRPIIRDFQQESAVFAIPPAMAWQALGTNYTPDEKMLKRVNDVVARLDADNFREREKAMQDLKALGQPAAIALWRIDRQKLSPQQSTAIDSFLADFSRLSQKQAQQMADDKSFLLDVLYSDDATLRQLALDRLSKIENRKIELVRDANEIAKLRAQILPTTQP